MPSARQRSDRPTTSRRASAAASRTPPSPAGTRTGSVTIPTTCWTSSEARASSRLASRRPRASSASVPTSRSVVPSDCGEPCRELDRGPVVIDAAERRHDRTGRPPPAPGEEGDVAGCAARARPRVLVGSSRARAARRAAARSRGRRRAPSRAARPRRPARLSCMRRRGTPRLAARERCASRRARRSRPRLVVVVAGGGRG